MICGVIPARGGSKIVPRKNLRPFLGRPLICHTIDAALAATTLDRVIVSTDDPEIAAVASAAGADVPFLRPAGIAADDTPTLAVLQHALQWFETGGGDVDAIVTLQATSPLRGAARIDEAVEAWRRTGADAVVSVCRAGHSPYWMGRLDGDRFVPLLADFGTYRQRQALPDAFRLNGAVYVTSRATLVDQGRILGADTRVVVMDADESVDIDTELDFAIAELIAARGRG